jgi:hypothetical protein
VSESSLSFFVRQLNMTQPLARLGSDLIAAWNSHDVDPAVALYAADFVGLDSAQAEPQYGPEEI